jgi:hypothetical protein
VVVVVVVVVCVCVWGGGGYTSLGVCSNRVLGPHTPPNQEA